MALIVLKVGGSMAAEPSKLRLLMAKLVEFSKANRLVIVPGGGEFADLVRSLDKRFCLDNRLSHRMAILAMDQYGLLLSGLSPDAVVVRSFKEVASASDKLSIFLPSGVLFREDPLENTWAVTSDSITLYIAHRLRAKKVLFVTDVDGIYTGNPTHEKPVQLIKEISPETLEAKGTRTSVDTALPRLLKRWPITCYVVNGFHPERIEALIEGKTTVATLITGKTS